MSLGTRFLTSSSSRPPEGFLITILPRSWSDNIIGMCIGSTYKLYPHNHRVNEQKTSRTYASTNYHTHTCYFIAENPSDGTRKSTMTDEIVNHKIIRLGPIEWLVMKTKSQPTRNAAKHSASALSATPESDWHWLLTVRHKIMFGKRRCMSPNFHTTYSNCSAHQMQHTHHYSCSRRQDVLDNYSHYRPCDTDQSC